MHRNASKMMRKGQAWDIPVEEKSSMTEPVMLFGRPVSPSPRGTVGVFIPQYRASSMRSCQWRLHGIAIMSLMHFSHYPTAELETADLPLFPGKGG